MKGRTVGATADKSRDIVKRLDLESRNRSKFGKGLGERLISVLSLSLLGFGLLVAHSWQIPPVHQSRV